MNPLLTRVSSSKAHSCPRRSPASHAVKKRRHQSDVPKKEDAVVRTRGPSTIKVTTTHKIRMLRELVTSMQEELRGLESKWVKQLPDELVLAIAHRCATEKHATNQTEIAHRELQELLWQQQFLFASLQTAVLRAPLHSNGGDLFKALHFGTQLGREEDEREKKLMAHNQRSLATLPSLVYQFSQMAINKVLLGGQTDDQAGKSGTPLSQIDVTGCKDCTLISSVFVSEISHTSLEVVYAAVLAYFDSIPTAMKRHFGIDAKRRKLNSAESPVHYQRSSFKGPGASWTENNIVCSDLTSSHGIVHIDAVTDDPLHPVSSTASSRYGICCLTISPRKEPVTGKILSVTLQWVVVYRYSMLAHDPEIKKDLEAIRPILNGDLITASLCSYIQELQQGHRQISHRKSWRLDQT